MREFKRVILRGKINKVSASGKKMILLCSSARACTTHGDWRHNDIGGCNGYG